MIRTLLLLSLLTGCSSAPVPRSPLETPLDGCGVSSRTYPWWSTIVDSSGQYILSGPSSLRRRIEKGFFFIHGGDLWSNEKVRVTLSFGHFGETSFETMKGRRCRVQTDGSPVFMIVDDHEVLAWYEDHEPGYDAVVSVSASEDVPIETLAGMALSLRRRARSRP